MPSSRTHLISPLVTPDSLSLATGNGEENLLFETALVFKALQASKSIAHMLNWDWLIYIGYCKGRHW